MPAPTSEPEPADPKSIKDYTGYFFFGDTNKYQSTANALNLDGFEPTKVSTNLWDSSTLELGNLSIDPKDYLKYLNS